MIASLEEWCSRHGYTLDIREAADLRPGQVAGAHFLPGRIVRVYVGICAKWTPGPLIEAIRAVPPGID